MFNDILEVKVGMDRPGLSFTVFNSARLSLFPYFWVQGPMALTDRIAYLFDG